MPRLGDVPGVRLPVASGKLNGTGQAGVRPALSVWLGEAMSGRTEIGRACLWKRRGSQGCGLFSDFIPMSRGGQRSKGRLL